MRYHFLAAFLVNSLAFASNLALSVLYSIPISATRGSSGFGSVNKLLIESKTIANKKSLSTFSKSKSWTPLRFEDVQTNVSLLVYIRMIDASYELDVWRFKGIVYWKIDFQKEHSSFIWTFFLTFLVYKVTGPIMIACQWNIWPPGAGPAVQFAGGS